MNRNVNRIAIQRFRSIKCAALVLLLVAVTYSSVFAQPDLVPIMRSCIYRVAWVEDSILHSATGVMIKFKNHLDRSRETRTFMLVNRHFVFSKTGKIIDSLFVFQNKLTSDSEVVSGPDSMIVHVNTSDTSYLLWPENDELDLVLIPIAGDNLKFNPDGMVHYGLLSSTLADRVDYLKIIDTNTILTGIGYPRKRAERRLRVRVPEYRWGLYLNSDGGWLKSNMPMLKGASGSASLAFKNGTYCLVAIHSARDFKGRSLATPVYYLRENFPQLFE